MFQTVLFITQHLNSFFVASWLLLKVGDMKQTMISEKRIGGVQCPTFAKVILLVEAVLGKPKKIGRKPQEPKAVVWLPLAESSEIVKKAYAVTLVLLLEKLMVGEYQSFAKTLRKCIENTLLGKKDPVWLESMPQVKFENGELFFSSHDMYVYYYPFGKSEMVVSADGKYVFKNPHPYANVQQIPVSDKILNVLTAVLVVFLSEPVRENKKLMQAVTGELVVKGILTEKEAEFAIGFFAGFSDKLRIPSCAP